MKKKLLLFVLCAVFVIYMICGCAYSEAKNDSADVYDKILLNTAKRLIEMTKRKFTFILEENESEITETDYNRDDYYISIIVSEEKEEGALTSA